MNQRLSNGSLLTIILLAGFLSPFSVGEQEILSATKSTARETCPSVGQIQKHPVFEPIPKNAVLPLISFCVR